MTWAETKSQMLNRAQHSAWPHDAEVMTWAKTKSQMPNRLYHSGTSAQQNFKLQITNNQWLNFSISQMGRFTGYEVGITMYHLEINALID